MLTSLSKATYLDWLKPETQLSVHFYVLLIEQSLQCTPCQYRMLFDVDDEFYSCIMLCVYIYSMYDMISTIHTLYVIIILMCTVHSLDWYSHHYTQSLVIHLVSVSAAASMQ